MYDELFDEEYSESDIVEMVQDALTYDDSLGIRVQGTFEGLGYLTRNKGLQIKIGSQIFDITIKER
jgi:hypothetical protein